MNPELESQLLLWTNLTAKIESLKVILDPLVQEERARREAVMAMAFPEGKEGANTLELPNDWKLKGTIKIDRKVDEAALPAVKKQLREMGVNADKLIRLKPEVEVREYRELSAEQAKVFEAALVIKRGASELKLVPPKTKEAT